MGTSLNDHVLDEYQGRIADLAKVRMAEKGITQQSLADAIGTTKVTVNRWLNGSPTTSIAVVESAMEILKIRLRP
jgi:transcriptional regulator with XRE-family HTH domain